MDRPLPWLRYIDADDLGDAAVDFDGMNVESPSGEQLGDIDGFILDSDSGRPYYVVVDSGGWLRSKHYLLPVGHARLDADREVLVADLSRDRIEKFPGFAKDEFEKLGVDDLKRFNDETCRACSISGVAAVYSDTEPHSAAWDRPDFRYPDWWSAQPSRPDRMGEAAYTAGAAWGVTPSEGETTRDRSVDATRKEHVVAREADPSPHFDGRAQPGDVIGVETAGERTSVGDTAEDENKRRREAESDASKLKE